VREREREREERERERERERICSEALLKALVSLVRLYT
jgi:hypothetical protein